MASHPRGRLRRTQTQFDREVEGEQHAERHRLAMQELVAEAKLGLERMAEGMTEIEERPLAALALIGRDDRGLGGAAPEHRLLSERDIAGDERRAVGLEPVIEAAIADES